MRREIGRSLALTFIILFIFPFVHTVPDIFIQAVMSVSPASQLQEELLLTGSSPLYLLLRPNPNHRPILPISFSPKQNKMHFSGCNDHELAYTVDKNGRM